MLSPKKVKFRKQMKGRRRGMAWRGSSLTFGEYGLQATGNGWVNAKEIEAARIAMTRYVKRGGQVYFLHNEVETIQQRAAKLAELVPEARIAIAHGQMPERELSADERALLHKQTAEGLVKLDAPETLLVPRAAVLQHTGAAVVYVDRGNRAYEARSIRLGRRRADHEAAE